MAIYWVWVFLPRMNYLDFIQAGILTVLCCIFWALIFNLENSWLNRGFILGGRSTVKPKTKKELVNEGWLKKNE